jgi:hypothetical protein
MVWNAEADARVSDPMHLTPTLHLDVSLADFDMFLDVRSSHQDLRQHHLQSC